MDNSNIIPRRHMKFDIHKLVVVNFCEYVERLNAIFTILVFEINRRNGDDEC